MNAAKFFKHFHEIEDPRQTGKVTHQLLDIFFLVVSANAAGAEGWNEIEDFGNDRLAWLKEYGCYENGIPTHDTINRVMGMIKPEQFEKCFINWMQDDSKYCSGNVVAIDGKTARGSIDRKNKKPPIHMVSAFSVMDNQVLGQVKTSTKSNEITAIPVLLDLLDIENSIVTIDAMGCQTNIAQKIIDKNADYLLAVKKNQGSLREAFDKHLSPAVLNMKITNELDLYECVEESHGRIECRQYLCFDLFDGFYQFKDKWPELKKLCVVISWRKQKDQRAFKINIRYYISSKDMDAKTFAARVRGHWAVENNLHWMLDVGMNEDASRIRQGNAAQVMSGVRKIVLNLFKRDSTRTAGIKRKQKMAMRDSDYLSHVLNL